MKEEDKEVRIRSDGGVAPMEERLLCTQEGTGSSPVASTTLL